MVLIKIVLEALGEVLGGLLGAIALTFLLWNLFKLVRHPEWGPWFALLLIGIAVATSVHMGRLLPMLTIFTLVAAVCTWSVSVL